MKKKTSFYSDKFCVQIKQTYFVLSSLTSAQVSDDDVSQC